MKKENMRRRGLYLNIWEELAADKSMIFLAGPRQAGKTTLAKLIADSFINNFYFNWDIPEHSAFFFENRAFFEVLERKDTSTPLKKFQKAPEGT